MIISIREVASTKQYDVLVNPQQKITDTINVLIGKKLLKINSISEIRSVKSSRQNVLLHIDKTFQEEMIYYGDILRIEKNDLGDIANE